MALAETQSSTTDRSMPLFHRPPARPSPEAPNPGSLALLKANEWLESRLRRGRAGPFSESFTLTPALARVLLERNPDNRPVASSKIATYARDIVAGRWTLNGETLKVSVEGHLNDGQHRCLAVIDANRPADTMIMFGLPRESRLTLDQGMARTPGHYLSMLGFKDSNIIAAAAGNLWQYENFGHLKRASECRPTKAQILATAEANLGLEDSCDVAGKANIPMVSSPGLMTFCHYVFAQRDRELADEFMRRFIVGNELPVGHPILGLRTRLQNAKTAKDRLHVIEKAELIFCAWYHFHNGSSPSSIRPGKRTLKDFT